MNAIKSGTLIAAIIVFFCLPKPIQAGAESAENVARVRVDKP